jgi:hypothetical protein
MVSAIGSAWNGVFGEGGFFEKLGNFFTPDQNGNWFEFESNQKRTDRIALMTAEKELRERSLFAAEDAGTALDAGREQPISFYLRALNKYTETKFSYYKKYGVALDQKDITEGFMQDVLNKVDLETGTGAERHNRILMEFRRLSKGLVFEDNATRNVYIAKMAERLVEAYNFNNPDGKKLTYGVDGGPSGYNPITPEGLPDIDKGKVDCTQFTSMVLYASAVTNSIMTASDYAYNLKNAAKIMSGELQMRFTENAFALNELTEGIYTYDKNVSVENVRKGGSNQFQNRSVFEPTLNNKPGVGTFGFSHNGSFTDHGYVVLGVNSDGTLIIAQSGGGPDGVNIRPDYNSRNDSFLNVRNNFNPVQLR